MERGEGAEWARAHTKRGFPKAKRGMKTVLWYRAGIVGPVVMHFRGQSTWRDLIVQHSALKYNLSPERRARGSTALSRAVAARVTPEGAAYGLPVLC